ncbi:MAG TPA: FtsX-like permease family protein [Chitinophagaceae bacterium]|nr:FtsX-like permease family protein [Chitinophagaceae bacterium]
MPMNLLFAWRYFKSKKSTNAINIIAWISVLAIMVATAALIIVLSVFNGFEDLVKGLYSDFYSDMKIVPATGKFFTITQQEVKKISSVAGVGALSFVAEESAVLVNGQYHAVIYLKGVDDNYTRVSKLAKHIVRGSYDLGTQGNPGLISGVGIENAVGANPVAEPPVELVIYLPNRKATNFNNLEALHSYNINATGTYMVQQDFDDKYSFTNLAFVQYMLDLAPNQYSSIEFSIKDPDKSSQVKANLQKILGSKFSVQTRLEENQSLFTTMQMEKWFIFALLSLILVVAAFNMIGALTMLVLEKQKDIAVLKAMGASNNRIMHVFLTEGFLLAGIGSASGMALAFLVCMAQIKFKLIKLTGGTFIIDAYPVKMYLQDFLLVTLTVSLVAVIASWIPSRKAATQKFSLKS